ncbi:hypothetical protein DFQ28_001300 [Apophysomyces sp. BC1034]|nr:hypothetical protein DFQ28_001300 [Apophysomyces sp. BC1034]
MNRTTTSHTNQYTGPAIALHWIIAALIIGGFAIGWVMTDIPGITPTKLNRAAHHMALGEPAAGPARVDAPLATACSHDHALAAVRADACDSGERLPVQLRVERADCLPRPGSIAAAHRAEPGA